MGNIADEFKKQYEDYDIISKIGLDTWQIRLKSYDKIAVLKKVDNPHIYKRLMPLKIKGIPLIYNIFEKENESYVIEEYINGSNLSELLSSKGSIDKRDTKDIILRLCDILSAIHNEDIIHRDIKPSNIIRTPHGEVYLIDFGIARTKNEKTSKDTRLLGTEFYASPEQYGFAQTDCRSDIYSLGRLMIVLITGRESTEGINKIPYSKIILKCTQIDASKRYGSVETLKRMFYLDLAAIGAVIGAVLVVLCFVFATMLSNNSDNKDAVNTEPTFLVTETGKEGESVLLQETTLQAAIEGTTAVETTSEVSTSAVSVKPSSIPSVSNKPSVSNNTGTASQPSIPAAEATSETTTESDIKIKGSKNLSTLSKYLLGLYRIHFWGKDLVSDEFVKTEKHLLKDFKLSDSINADIYTEWNGSEFIIKINDGNALKIPELTNIESANYKEGMVVYKYYSVNYHDFDKDGIKDIYLNEAVYGHANNDYVPFFFVNTFIKINSDLTMQVLSNENPVIKDLDDLYYIGKDDYVSCEIFLGDKIGTYKIKDNKVYWVLPEDE